MCQTILFGVQYVRFRWYIQGHIDLFLYFEPESISQVLNQVIQIHLRINEFHLSGFYLRHIQDIVNQMKKHVVVCLDDLGKLLPFFFVVRFGHKCRETYNGVERCPYVMAHIGEESAFEAVGFFGFFT